MAPHPHIRRTIAADSGINAEASKSRRHTVWWAPLSQMRCDPCNPAGSTCLSKLRQSLSQQVLVSHHRLQRMHKHPRDRVCQGVLNFLDVCLHSCPASNSLPIGCHCLQMEGLIPHCVGAINSKFFPFFFFFYLGAQCNLRMVSRCWSLSFIWLFPLLFVSYCLTPTHLPSWACIIFPLLLSLLL